eukprot:Skav208360  [mRNA]  locus=scaffold1964:344442:349927:+ [translate_table: standard]
MMKHYVAVLEHDLSEIIDVGLDLRSREDLLHLSFQLAVVGITDCWRRLVYDFSSPPFCLFDLISLSTDVFIKRWRNLHDAFSTCSSCFDDAFSGVLLSHFPMSEFDGQTVAQREETVSTIKQLLMDVAIWSPLSSDLVEIKNGQVQWAVSKRGRQCVKGVNNAREQTLLQSCIRQFAAVKHEVNHRTLPSKMKSSGILKMSGVMRDKLAELPLSSKSEKEGGDDSNGALRLSAIDVSTSDADIQEFLNKTLHSQVGATAVENTLPDQCLPNQCQAQSSSHFVGKLVRSLHQSLSQRKLAAGCLLCLKTACESYACILGVVQKKPIVQTLLRVSFQSNGDIVMMLQDGVPDVVTSHQLLRRMELSDQKPSFNVQVWDYKMKFVDGHMLIACADNMLDDFEVTTTQKSKQPREKAKLPFDLHLNPKYKKQKKVKPTTRKPFLKKKACSDKQPIITESEKAECSTESSSSSTDSDAEAEASNQNVDMNKESNEIEPISECHAAEEKQAVEIALDVQKTDEKKEELAEQQKTPAKTFFSQHLGLDEAGLAASSRSVCLKCKEKIPKNTVRYSWHHSRLRPPGWVHSYCVYSFAQSTGLQTRAIERLRVISQQASGSGAGEVQQDAAKSRDFGMPQSRARVYILMIRNDLILDEDQVKGFLHLVTQTLPGLIEPATVKDVLAYVKDAHDLIGDLEYPPDAKD